MCAVCIIPGSMDVFYGQSKKHFCPILTPEDDHDSKNKVKSEELHFYSTFRTFTL